MGIFSRTPQPVRSGDAEAAAAAKAAVADLVARIEALEEGESLRKLEIEDWYEKFAALYARLNKRVQRETAAAAASETPQREPNPAALKILGGMR